MFICIAELEGEAQGKMSLGACYVLAGRALDKQTLHNNDDAA